MSRAADTADTPTHCPECDRLLESLPCDGCGWPTPETPREALDHFETLYRTAGTGARGVHRTRQCRALRGQHSDVVPVETPAGLQLRARLCSECFETGGRE